MIDITANKTMIVFKTGLHNYLSKRGGIWNRRPPQYQKAGAGVLR
jgi:hypothetical protein